MAAIATIVGVPAAQTSELAADIWWKLFTIRGQGQRVHLQWMPAHCGATGDERADALAMKASCLPQNLNNTAIDIRMATKAFARAASKRPPTNAPVSSSNS